MPEIGPQSKEKLLNNAWHGRTCKSQSMIKNLFSKLFKVDVKHKSVVQISFFFVFSFIFISWRLITLQYCSVFFHTLTWISHAVTCVPHPDPPSCHPPHPIPLGLPSAPAPSACLMHPTWAGDLFHTW